MTNPIVGEEKNVRVFYRYQKLSNFKFNELIDELNVLTRQLTRTVHCTTVISQH